MHKIITILTILCTVFTLGGGTLRAQERQTSQEEAQLGVLEGVLKQHPKYLFRYYLQTMGSSHEAGLSGQEGVFLEIPVGSKIRVKGRLSTRHHEGGSEQNPSPFPPAWYILMDVDSVEVLREAKGEPGGRGESTLESVPFGPTLAVFTEQIEAALSGVDPAPEYEIPFGYNGTRLTVRHKTRQYLVYTGTESGKIDSDPVEREGPAEEGLLLQVYVQDKGEMNMPKAAQIIRQPYWWTYVNVVPVADPDKQLYFALSYRRSTDERLIEKIKQILEQRGRWLNCLPLHES